jgi:predicted DNA-binding transcriptional regulator AlpA
MFGTGLTTERRPRDLARTVDIALSKWVNEGLPPCRDLLSAHDIARITRRPRWVLELLALTGGFPAKASFQGRPLGWLRHDVVNWMAGSLSVSVEAAAEGAQFAQTPTHRGCASARSIRDGARALHDHIGLLAARLPYPIRKVGHDNGQPSHRFFRCCIARVGLLQDAGCHPHYGFEPPNALKKNCGPEIPPPVHLGGRACGWRSSALQRWISDPDGYCAKPAPAIHA